LLIESFSFVLSLKRSNVTMDEMTVLVVEVDTSDNDDEEDESEETILMLSFLRDESIVSRKLEISGNKTKMLVLVEKVMFLLFN